MTTRRLAAGLVGLGLCFLPACGGDGGGSTTVIQTKTITTPAGKTKVVPKAPAATAITAGTGRPAHLKRRFHSYNFLSPTKNIACLLTENGARCDIREYTWTPPPKPASCEFDYGGTLNVSGHDKGEVGCVSDSLFDAKQILDYGTFVTLGRFRCTSRSAGVTCESAATGHGFLMARQDYSVY